MLEGDWGASFTSVPGPSQQVDWQARQLAVSLEGDALLVANRFRWENCGETADMPPVDPAGPAVVDAGADATFATGCRTYERVNCGVAFDGVEAVRRRGIDPRDRARMLELLSMRVEADAVTLEFAGKSALRLEGARITCRLSDLGDPWPTQWRPRHPGNDTL